MNINNFDLEKYQKEAGTEFKVIYDVFCSYFLHIYEGENRSKHAQNLSPSQTLQMIKWVDEYAIPFYESTEEYEKCNRLKNVNKFLRQEKNLENFLP